MSFTGKFDDLNVDTLNVHKITCFSNFVHFGNACNGIIIEDMDILNQPGSLVSLNKLIGTNIKSKNGIDCVNLDGVPLLTYSDPNCNTFLGQEAGNLNTIGMGNSVFGCRIFDSNINGEYNTCTGQNTARLLDNSNSNIIIGGQEVLYYGTGNFHKNVLIGGKWNGYGITSGIENVGIGWGSLAWGYPPLGNIDKNIAIGVATLNNISDSLGNIGIGYAAVQCLTATQSNTGIGFRTMYYTTGTSAATNDNTAIGEYGMYSLSSGSNNTLIGEFSSNSGLTIANNTTSLGWQAVYTMRESTVGIGWTTQSGDYSVNIGLAGGFFDRPRCIGIGYFSRPYTDNIKIGGEGSNETMYINYGTACGMGSLSTLLGGFPIGTFSMRDTAFGAGAMRRFDELDDCVALGYQASQLTNSEKRNVTLGANSNAIGVNNTVVIGQGATAGHSDTIVLGNGASTSATNQMAVNGMTVTGASSGASGNFLQVRLGGVAYKIPLHNP